MPREESIDRHQDKIVASSSNSDYKEHVLLWVDLEQAPKRHASTHEAGPLSAISQS